MNVFETHTNIVKDYASYIRSFINIADPAIKAKVDEELDKGKLWPEPLLQFNPSFEGAGQLSALTREGMLHSDLAHIFKGYSLYAHQVEAIKLGLEKKDFVVTSGTGSGKSLTYIGTIFHHLLSTGVPDGVVAVVVYPMNALINSQYEEFDRYKKNYEESTGRPFPINFGQYTGQEKEEVREKMREKPPHILLTNYMMLELLLTRIKERPLRNAIYDNLKFLVFDELHTYRGRQGADIAMLIRRIRARSRNELTCIGTSATMVSVGSHASQKEEVAKVAATLFGRKFKADQVVSEKLARSLASNSGVNKTDLSNALNVGINPAGTLDDLKKHPLAVWLETKIALNEKDGRLGRGKPLTLSFIASLLSEESGVEIEKCINAIVGLLSWISAVNKSLQDGGQRYTVLPFRLHQFISQTGSVYTTLDQDENRFITLEPGIFKQDEEGKKPIFPNVFSRSSGHAFICVTRVDNKLEPREFRDSSDDEDQGTDGYLIIGENVWDPVEDLDSLPETWLQTRKTGTVIDPKKRPFFPIRLYFDEYGNCSETEPMKWSGWFMRAPLLFDPTGGVFFDTKTSEGTKLTKLGSEGRSTSTTITGYSILNQLNESGYHPRDQKLLSFTDNRQDAALQAGHFNDFVQVIRLRGGIHKALVEAPNNTLNYATLGEAVARALNLRFTDYANKNEEPALANVRRIYEQALQTFVTYRAVADLRRSWRIVLPNLEQCGLLSIDYLDLESVCESNDFWSDLDLVSELNQKERAQFLGTILDFFRLEFAIHSENFLTHAKIKENEKEFREKLRPPWTLERQEEIREPFYIRLRTLHQTARFYSKSAGPASGLGKFIKQFARERSPDLDLRGDHYTDFIGRLMRKLEEADYLRSQIARDSSNEETPIYRLKIEKLIWKLGDGETVKADLIKQRSYKDQTPKPNEFFRELYRRDLARVNGFFSLITTNSIKDGDVREDGLAHLIGCGGEIVMAVRGVRWPGRAKLVVSLVSIHRGKWTQGRNLDGQIVSEISAFLESEGSLGNPIELAESSRRIFTGYYWLGDGFLLTHEDAVRIIKSDKRNSEVIFSLINGEEINSEPDQSPQRSIINFRDWSLEKASTFHEPFKIVESLVKPFRETRNRERNRDLWWIYAENRPGLTAALGSLKFCFAAANTTKYLNFSAFPTTVIISHPQNVFATDRWDLFSVVQSTVHEVWARKYSGALKQDLRYSPSKCFDTYPFPGRIWNEPMAALAALGEKYHAHRKSLMLSLWLGLTDVYNLFHSRDLESELKDGFAARAKKDPQGLAIPPEHRVKAMAFTYDQALACLLELRRMHVELDNAVRDAYGWSDLNLGHDFYEVETLPENDRVRYTISPVARKELLQRLLKLNHERAAEEASKEQSSNGKPKKKKSKSEHQNLELFSSEQLK